MRLVLDTNVVVSGLLWSGPPSQLIRKALASEVEDLGSFQGIPIVEPSEALRRIEEASRH